MSTPPAPDGIGEELADAARRLMAHLPDAVLRAMATGLRTNADDLVPGALFRRRDSGGCAVGVILRELAPHAFQFGRIEFWLWHRWRRGIEPDVAERFPQLQQLQCVFDDAVSAVAQAGHDEQPARAVGLWLAESAEAQLVGHKPTKGRRPSSTPSRWHRRRSHRSPRAESKTAGGAHREPDVERTSCS